MSCKLKLQSLEPYTHTNSISVQFKLHIKAVLTTVPEAIDLRDICAYVPGISFHANIQNAPA
ncbi:25756_t:CDS:2 [Gigaspora rosea]|nr:25756_t:CDS:2 [Gigaspora rosea]